MGDCPSRYAGTMRHPLALGAALLSAAAGLGACGPGGDQGPSRAVVIGIDGADRASRRIDSREGRRRRAGIVEVGNAVGVVVQTLVDLRVAVVVGPVEQLLGAGMRAGGGVVAVVAGQASVAVQVVVRHAAAAAARFAACAAWRCARAVLYAFSMLPN